MPLIQNHESHKFVGGNIQLAVVNKKRNDNVSQGGNIISTVSNLISNNSDLISNVGKVAGAVGSIASASNSITNAVKSANELRKLSEIRQQNIQKNKEKELQNSSVNKNKINEILEKNFKPIVVEYGDKVDKVDKTIPKNIPQKYVEKGDGFKTF